MILRSCVRIHFEAIMVKVRIPPPLWSHLDLKPKRGVTQLLV